jgi:hypothetical protein
MSSTIKLHATRRDDGRLLITSEALPGFRFLTGPEEDQSGYTNPLLMALREYYPILKAQQAKREAKLAAEHISLHGGALSYSVSTGSQNDFDLEAQFSRA